MTKIPEPRKNYYDTPFWLRQTSVFFYYEDTVDWAGKYYKSFMVIFSSSFKRWRYFRPLPNLIKTSLKKYHFTFG